MPRYYYTDKQIEVNKWIQDMGFITEMEVPKGEYCVDIEIPEISWIVEIDGPQHYRKERMIRDDYLFENFGIKGITHVFVEVAKERFIDMFKDGLERVFGEDNNGSNGIEKRNK